MEGGDETGPVGAPAFDGAGIVHAADHATFAEGAGPGHDRRGAVRPVREDEAKAPAPGGVAGGIVRVLGQGVGTGDADVARVLQERAFPLEDALALMVEPASRPTFIKRSVRRGNGFGVMLAMPSARRRSSGTSRVRPKCRRVDRQGPARRALQDAGCAEDGASQHMRRCPDRGRWQDHCGIRGRPRGQVAGDADAAAVTGAAGGVTAPAAGGPGPSSARGRPGGRRSGRGDRRSGEGGNGDSGGASWRRFPPGTDNGFGDGRARPKMKTPPGDDARRGPCQFNDRAWA